MLLIGIFYESFNTFVKTEMNQTLQGCRQYSCGCWWALWSSL